VNSASASNIEYDDNGQMLQTSATNAWTGNYLKQNGKSFDFYKKAKVAGFIFAFAISPITAMVDPWLNERYRRDAAVTMSIYQDIIGRFISRKEALRLSAQILKNAEKERDQIVAFEAMRGIQWGEE
jgi:hypothetical protein